MRKALQRRSSKETQPFPNHVRPIQSRVDLAVLDGTTGRTVLQNEAIHGLQCIQIGLAERDHLLGQILSRGGLHQSLSLIRGHQADGIPGSPQADLHLRANLEKLDVGDQLLHERRRNDVPIVSTGVEAKTSAGDNNRAGVCAGCVLADVLYWRGAGLRSCHISEYSSKTRGSVQSGVRALPEEVRLAIGNRIPPSDPRVSPGRPVHHSSTKRRLAVTKIYRTAQKPGL